MSSYPPQAWLFIFLLVVIVILDAVVVVVVWSKIKPKDMHTEAALYMRWMLRTYYREDDLLETDNGELLDQFLKHFEWENLYEHLYGMFGKVVPSTDLEFSTWFTQPPLPPGQKQS